MGIYNCGSTLSEAIESIIAQTYANWELIMCDDGSADNTYEVAEEYARKYPQKIKLIRHQKNQGLNITLNDCLHEATGEYVARMDGDDISLPERFENQVKILDEHPEYAIVSSPMIYFDKSGDWGRGAARAKPGLADFINCTPFCHAPAMVRKEAYDKCNGYSLDKHTLRCEDYDLWARMFALGYRGYNLQKPYYKMRDDKNAFHRRKLKFAFYSCVTRIRVARLLHLPLKAYLVAFRPIFVSLLPWQVYRYFHVLKKK